ncbi:hypothetical protein [Paenibacillus azoreducens]|uniref:MORN repeat-containing protein n=1 Tax=Paenibacillus azoreducens TaxID=116718 RepID=A0A919YF32_9BACL|nr:hypothetical protein [Paenibacillus azoreducens]GIO48488.1 hypothetical protein J34TS1_32530 [Paenibacillus azoreducens]
MYKLMLAVSILLGTVTGAEMAHAQAAETTLDFGDGSVYTGQVKNGKPNGKGTLISGRLGRYEGNWVNGVKSGFGKYTFHLKEDKVFDKEDKLYHDRDWKTHYEGQWANNRQNGQGTEVHSIRDASYQKKEDGGWIQKEGGYSYEIRKGSFKDDDFTAGYSGYLDDEFQAWFAYKDSKVAVKMEGKSLKLIDPRKVQMLDSNADEQLASYSFHYSNKNNKNLYDEIHLSPSVIAAGTYKNNQMIDGVKIIKKVSGIESTWTQQSYNNGKPGEVKNITETAADQSFAKYRSSYLSLITPYLKGFDEIRSKADTFLNQ